MQDTPKQTRLLGATVRRLGVIVAVSSTLHFGYAIVEGADRVNHRVALRELKREAVVFPAAPQPYRTQVERVGYDLWSSTKL